MTITGTVTSKNDYVGGNSVQFETKESNVINVNNISQEVFDSLKKGKEYTISFSETAGK